MNCPYSNTESHCEFNILLITGEAISTAGDCFTRVGQEEGFAMTLLSVVLLFFYPEQIEDKDKFKSDIFEVVISARRATMSCTHICFE